MPPCFGAYEPFFVHLAFLTKTSSATCSVLDAVQLVPIFSAERAVEFQSGPRKEMNANHWVSAAVDLEHSVSNLSHSNQGWKRPSLLKVIKHKKAFLETKDFSKGYY